MLPWQETSVEAERLQFIERRAVGEEPHAESCRQFGISRKTGYKLIGRYEAYGEEGLRDRSRAAHDHPNARPRELEERIVAAKRAHPRGDPRSSSPGSATPSPACPGPLPVPPAASSSGPAWYSADGARRRASPWNEPFAHAIVANDVWAIDLQGLVSAPATGRASIPSPSRTRPPRYLIACRGLERPTGPETRRALARAFREYGLPRVIRTRQRPALRQRWLGQPLPAGRLVGQAGHPP